VLRDGVNVKPARGLIGIEFGNHPIISGLDWRIIAADASAAESPGEGWRPLIRSGPLVLVAVRDQPARQVWVGFTSPTFPMRKEYPIFWTKVFDWVGGGEEQFSYQPMQSLGREWKLASPAVKPFDPSPGIYRRDDGQQLAMNAIDVKLNNPPQTDWRRKLNAMQTTAAGATEFRPGLLLMSLLLLFASMFFWKRSSAEREVSRPFSGTV
jgi:hypothetical protein